MRPPFYKIFVQAKFLELFSLIMNASFGNPLDSCPVIINREIEQKLQKARRHVIENLDTPPDPDSLAIELSIPRSTLKEGFKYIYGKTIHQFHNDYKMEAALSMLKSGTKLVKEIAYDIGYQNPSHFIAAFKRKYGETPKQYLKNQ
jgi:AraC-like DNA-binding protein